MNMERTKFAHDPVARRVLVLLRMSGKTQEECADILNTTTQNVSIEEQEFRFQEQVDNFVSILASAVDIPDRYKKHFPAPDTEDDIRKIQKGVYV